MTDPQPTADEGERRTGPGPPVTSPGLEPVASWDFRDDLLDSHGIMDAIVLEGPAPAGQTYHVPTRFGMSAILGITTALAILFGVLRATSSHEVVYLFFGLLAMVICLVQMRWGDVPRQASIFAGAILSSLFVIALPVFARRGPGLTEMFCLLVMSVPVGGFLGYITGACAGGVFLLMDLFEKYWTERAARSRLDGSGQQG
jgi:hypothetical protein